MKGNRFSEEQIIGVMKKAGVKTADLCRATGLQSRPLTRWKSKFGYV